MTMDARSAEIELRIPFHDLDPVNIVWHGNYAKYFEQARCALLATFNYNYDQMRISGYIWPVIDLHMRYIKPLYFNQRVRVRATLVEWEYRLKIIYLISDADSGERLAKGTSIQVAVDSTTKVMCLLSPRVLFERLGLEYPV
ncbi:MAG: acyl-CoA thioesterase [Steroidobacteraceae bacterium]